MRKLMKRSYRLRRWTSLLCVFFAALLLVEMLPIAALGENNSNVIEAEDISNYITWSDGKLEVETDGEWVAIEIGSTSEFPYGDYRYTISWEADSQRLYQAGDYFIFSVPVEFADLTLEIFAEDGTVLGTVRIDEEGHGIATLTEKVEEMAEMSGVVSFQGTYSESGGIDVEKEVQLGSKGTDAEVEEQSESEGTGAEVEIQPDSKGTDAEVEEQSESEGTGAEAEVQPDSEGASTEKEVQPDSEGTNSEQKNESTADLRGSNRQARVNNEGPTNVSNYIDWSDGVLTVKQGDDWVVIDPEDGAFVFPATSNYLFEISWEADSDQSYENGDYFTFTVPKEFGNMTLKATSGDGTVLANIIIDKDGNGKVVFTSAIEEMKDIHGTISFVGEYWEQETGKDVEWIFEFSDTVTYEGTSGGYDPGTVWEIPTGLSKYGYYQNGAYYWNIDLHLEADQLTNTDTVTVTDTFGGGYMIDVLGNHDPETCDQTHNGVCDWLDDNSDFHQHYPADTEGYNDHAYFEIYAIDWDKIREDYMAGGGTFVPEGMYTPEMLSMINDDYPKYYIRVTPSAIEITDEGMKLEFAADELEGKYVQIVYWYELTTLRPIESITNSVKVIGAGEIPEVNSEIKISGGATVDGIKGTKGQLQLYKQNSSENLPLLGAEFTLTKEGSSYSEAKATEEGGKLTFALEKENNTYKGTYTLTETKAPDGYKVGVPITIELNDNGEIVKVNNQSISAGNSSGTLIEEDGKKICWVSGDQLALIVHNYISNDETTSITANKIWEDDNDQANVRPDKIEVQLFANGDEYGDPVELNAGKGWSHTWENLPKKQDEAEIIYTVKEVKVPEDYTVSYSEDTLTITNKYTPIPGVDLHFTKIDAADYDNPIHLSGAKFTLYKATGEVDDHSLVTTDSGGNPEGNWEVVDMYESNEEGLFDITNLQSGIYQLVETKAPAGYQLPIGQWRFVIDAEKGEISNFISIAGNTAPLAVQGDQSAGYLIGNVKEYTLPLTGRSGIYWFVVSGLGCVLLGMSLKAKHMYDSKYEELL